MIKDRLDRPLRDLRLSLIDACNLRCPYCLPAELFPDQHPFMAPQQRLAPAELLRLLGAFQALGLRKVKLTGGEPLLYPGLVELVAGIRRQLPELELGLITNGILLKPKLAALRDAGLDSVTISLDTLRPERWPLLTGRPQGLATVLEAIEAARGLFPVVKVNMVPIRGLNDDEVEAMCLRFRAPGLALRFIEYMDVGTLNHWRRDQVIASAEIRQRLFAMGPLLPLPARHPGETAERWAWADGQGEVGFIGSITEPFCGDCARARLSSDGVLYGCLFATTGLDLKGPLRAGMAGPDLNERIKAFWNAREDRYSELRSATPAAPARGERIEMFAIGG